MSASVIEVGAEEVGDDALLRRYVRRREPEAFAELARRHAGLVHATCLRITADRHDAEELTQECFFLLARNAAAVRTSVAGWLHQTATHRALNAVRARGRRRAHEAEAVQARRPEVPADDPTWREVEPILDEAVESLPDELREAIVLHFLRSLPQSEVAARLGVHQSTVSRRVAEGLRRLHDRLQTAGVALATVPLGDLLAAHAAPCGPDPGGVAGRLALVGAAGSIGSAWVKFKTGVWLVGSSFLAVIVEIVAGSWWAILASALWVVFLVRFRPGWVDELAPTADGGSMHDDPFNPLRRWNWTAMPPGWERRMILSFAIASMFGLQAWGGFHASQGGVPLVGVFALYSGLALSTGLRIVMRAAVLPRGPRKAAEGPSPDAPRVAQALGAALGATLMFVCFGRTLLRIGERWDVAAAYLGPLAFCGVWTVVDAARKLRRYRDPKREAARLEAAPNPENWSPTIAAAISLGFAAWLSTAPLFAVMIRWGNPGYAASAQGLRQFEASSGLVPALALTILSMAIVPLARARATMRPDVWGLTVALASVCAAIDLASCLAYLLLRS